MTAEQQQERRRQRNDSLSDSADCVIAPSRPLSPPTSKERRDGTEPEVSTSDGGFEPASVPIDSRANPERAGRRLNQTVTDRMTEYSLVTERRQRSAARY